MAGIVAMAVGVPMAMGVTTTATVGGKDPTVSVDAIADVTPDPCPADTQFYVTGEVNDENGKADIVSVGYMLKNHSTSSLIDSGYAALTDINATAKSFNATVTVGCCIPAGDYDVHINVTDQASSTYDFGPYSVKIKSIISLNLDFTAVAYASVEINTPKCVYGDALTTTAEKPTVTNKGNGNMKLNITATTMSGPSGAVDMNLGAKVLGDGTPCEDMDNLPPSTEVPFAYEFTCNTSKPVDFSINVPDGTLPGNYVGTITITGVKA